MSASDKRRRRLRLWRESPLCRMCGAETVLPETLAFEYGDANKAPLAKRMRMATIEHIFHRLDGPRPRWGELTLYCFKCNNGDNARRQAEAPLAELQRRSGRSRSSP